jgi:hypothetical protein
VAEGRIQERLEQQAQAEAETVRQTAIFRVIPALQILVAVAAGLGHQVQPELSAAMAVLAS